MTNTNTSNINVLVYMYHNVAVCSVYMYSVNHFFNPMSELKPEDLASLSGWCPSY